jgi:hypothetical protein
MLLWNAGGQENEQGTPMLYNGHNAVGATVYDVNTKAKLWQVVSVDTDKGEVVRHHEPIRVEGNEIATYTERYRSIHAIRGHEPRPVLFHCYDRLSA